MRLRTLFEHTAELIRIAYSSPNPTDKLISDIFRKKKNYGSKERKFVSNTLYFYFRNKYLIDYLSRNLTQKQQFENNYTANVIVSVAFSIVFPEQLTDYHPVDILGKLDKNFVLDEFLENEFGLNYNEFVYDLIENYVELNQKIDVLKSIELNTEEIESLEIFYSFPKLLIQKILQNFDSIDQLKLFLDNSRKQAPITIRVNTLKTSAENIQSKFRNIDIITTFSELVPNALRLTQRVQFSELNDFKNGFFEIQDEGSQLISLFLNPEQDDKVLDACAGAGGKSLHIATLLNDSSEIIANDTEFARLMELPKRANRCGIKSIKINLTVKNSKQSIIKPGYFDKVLIDAPCSGLGTIRRDPLKKYRFTNKILEKLVINQKSILQHYSQFVAVGGTIVYSTCSILNEENIDIAKNFLGNNPNFEPVVPTDIIEKYKLNGKLRLIGLYYISVDFGNSTSDGFFMSKFRRLS